MSGRIRAALRHCPSREAWAAELENSFEEPEMLKHVEHCAQCQRVLDELAADAPWWKEAGKTLSTRFADMSHLTQSVCALSSDQARAMPADPLNEYEIAQLQRMLAPASHPELLARIGRYELEQLIGRGGMGLVFRAWDSELHRVVAVKTLAMALMPVGAARERFIREGRAAAMLNHPNIVPLYDVITDPPIPALVMQYIAGPTLENWITQHGPMPWQDALRIGSQLADALHAAHVEGLVHRDIKPSNVLLEADGTRALLTDFGLVRAMDDAALTHSGMLAGTPHFMSPEQARSDEVDGRSDLFSLGALLYFVMAGQPPFRGREPMAVLNNLCHTTQIPLCRVNREIPIEVSRLVDQLLSKQACKRPVSSQAVRDQLRALLVAPRRLHRQQKLVGLATHPLTVVAALASLLLLADFASSQFDILKRVRFEATRGTVPTPLVSTYGSNALLDTKNSDAISSTSQSTESTSPGSSRGEQSSSRNDFVDMDQLARQSAELEAMIDAYWFDLDGRVMGDAALREPFINVSRESALIQVQLNYLQASQPDSVGSSSGP